jgi:hypothetical protein
MAAISILPTGANGTLTQLAKALGANPAVSDAPPEATTGSGAIIVGFSAKAATAGGARKDFATVAKEARTTLDAGYRKLGKTGDIYTTGEEWRTAFGGLDRRSLYAVASDKGGQFSKEEQGAAQYLMAQQQGAAMGLDAGATRFQNDPAAGYQAGIAFLDSVSDEEKASFEWAVQRAASQYAYEVLMRRDGKEPEILDSTNPIVKVIKGALEALATTDDPSNLLEDMPEYKQAERMHAALAARESAGASGLIDVSA